MFPRRDLQPLLLCFGLCAIACDQSATAPFAPGSTPEAEAAAVGDVQLALQLEEGVAIDEVTYEISGPGIASITGALEVSELEGSVFTAIVGGVPAGPARTIALSATASDGSSCEGEATFDVVGDTLTAVQISLHCGAPPRGSIDVDVDVERCPAIAAASAVPGSAELGQSIHVAIASALDGLEPASVSWTAPTGTFGDPAAAATTYVCAAAGTQTLTVLVTDAASGCSDSIELDVDCTEPAAECGDGVVEADEECDDGNLVDGDGCSAECLQEQPVSICGDGIPEEGEECDDGNLDAGDGCSPMCTVEDAPDPCSTCALDNCRAYGELRLDAVAGCYEDAVNPENVASCTAVVSCARENECAEDNLGACYCGTALPVDCLAGIGVDGPCRSVIEDAAATTDPSIVATRVDDRAYAVGDAALLLACYATHCAEACL